ncbi:GNAT family N-acetyltransferase [Thalassococcus lentus]|uniref:GNAT family N-acetyltransferase n=1 Tax=Thalassococcus lentus TaxID=1210524 RepID=A0ABT4XXE8_9RHOB|nr:GNAT family N-acetyltransferase [Thalassococcus lentus]MDA7426647.1 GNAT family N-acetyltransferase [Thalassococcus lentus]
MTCDLPLPLPQSVPFAKTCTALGLPVRHHKQQCAGRVTLSWQVQSRTLPLLGRIDLISRGPVSQDPQHSIDWLWRWQRWHDGRPLVLNAENLSATVLRGAGFWPVMTPASLAILPLRDEQAMRAALAQKWRNRLNRALAQGVSISRHDLKSGHWILQAERQQARAKRYRGLPPEFCAAYARVNPGHAAVFEARRNGAPVAAAAFLRHGAMATWQMGYSSPAGRRCNAMNALLWRAALWLKEQGHSLLDLGTLNAQDAPGLTHFKRGTGAQIRTLSGTWLHMGSLAPLARRLPIRFAA